MLISILGKLIIKLSKCWNRNIHITDGGIKWNVRDAKTTFAFEYLLCFISKHCFKGVIDFKKNLWKRVAIQMRIEQNKQSIIVLPNSKALTSKLVHSTMYSFSLEPPKLQNQHISNLQSVG